MIDAPQDPAAQFLDLAAFADRLLDTEETERVAAWLAADPDVAADVSAARSPGVGAKSSPQLERIIARACAISPDTGQKRGQVIEFAGWRVRRLVQGFAQWGSIAAAIAVASWLGFAMGSDATLTLSQPRTPNDTGFIPELFDPASGFLRDLSDGLRT